MTSGTLGGSASLPIRDIHVHRMHGYAFVHTYTIQEIRAMAVCRFGCMDGHGGGG